MMRRLIAGMLCAAWIAPVPALAEPMQDGRVHLAEGDHGAAIKSYSDALRNNPSDPVALNNMGIAKAAAGEYQAAVELLTRAHNQAPYRDDIRENLNILQGWARTYGSAGTPPAAASPGDLPALWPAVPRQPALAEGWQLNPVCSTPTCK